jgi:flagellar hook-associated protein 1 FlgK
VFQGGTSGLGAAVNDMLNAFSDVTSAPTDLTARTVVLTRANETAARFRASSARLDDIQAGVISQLQQSADAINSLATRIATTNGQIALATGNGQSPNSLLDQRDQLVHELNQYVQTSSLPATDGTVGIFLANSQALVLGTGAATVSVGKSEFPGDTASATLVIQQGVMSVPLDQANLGGGSVKGLLSFLNNDLPEGRNLLGRMALAIGTVVNDQHRLGLDLNGNPGGDLFRPATLPDGIPAATNSVGSPTIGLSVSSAAALAVSNYELTFTSGTAGNIVRLSDQASIPFDFAAPPVVVDGVTLSASGAAAAGDRYLLKPMATAAGQIDTAFTSPRDLAVANQVEVRTGVANQGGLAVSSLAAQLAGASLTNQVQLTFNAGGTFDVQDLTSATSLAVGVSYTPGQPISYNGWSLTLTGTPQPGDTMLVQAASPAFAATNAGNAAALLSLRDMALFDGAPLTDGYAAAISQVGIRAQSAKFSASVSDSMATNLEKDRAGVAGVNLDEEAAKLLQFQQSYQAAAKMMQIAQSIFDTLMQTISR